MLANAKAQRKHKILRRSSSVNFLDIGKSTLQEVETATAGGVAVFNFIRSAIRVREFEKLGYFAVWMYSLQCFLCFFLCY